MNAAVGNDKMKTPGKDAVTSVQLPVPLLQRTQFPDSREDAPMRRHALSVLAFMLVSVARADEPRSVVERAVKAMGLDVDAAKRPAIVVKFTFNAPNKVKGDGTIRFAPTGARRLDMTGEESGRKETIVVVLDGDKAFARESERTHEFIGDQLAMIRTIEPLFSPLALPGLLADKDVTFKDLDEMQVDSRPARRIQASVKGKTCDLYFDKETGHLVRAVGKIENIIEVTSNFSDYRELGRDRDERALKAAGVEDAGLVAFLRKRQPDPKGLEKAAALVRKLGDDDFDSREKAVTELVDLGVVAIPALQKALKDKDAEVVRRARTILDVLEARNDQSLLASAIRQVARKRPEGGIDALFGLLPGAPDITANEIKAALVALSMRDGKPERVLFEAAEDRRAQVRAAVAAALGRDGGDFLKQPGRVVFGPGCQLPARTTLSVQGEKMEFETTGVMYHNAFDAKLFAKP
jgi:hypothetical protein